MNKYRFYCRSSAYIDASRCLKPLIKLIKQNIICTYYACRYMQSVLHKWAQCDQWSVYVSSIGRVDRAGRMKSGYIFQIIITESN